MILSVNVPRKILVADTEPAIRQLIARILSPWNARIIEAEDRIHATILALQYDPDLFLVADDLSDSKDFDVAADLRLALDHSKSTPIVILSHDPEPILARGIAPTWDAWIRKPFDVTRLRDEILRVFGRRNG